MPINTLHNSYEIMRSKNRAKNDHKKIYAPMSHFGMEFADARFVPSYIR